MLASKESRILLLGILRLSSGVFILPSFVDLMKKHSLNSKANNYRRLLQRVRIVFHRDTASPKVRLK